MPSGTTTTCTVDTTDYELEDYIYEMQCQAERAVKDTTMEQEEDKDVYTCLAEKESNLVLAAELGKALLTRNEVLVQENERMAEEFSRKLEELEQDKHLLRRKLVSTEGEYEVKIHELGSDLQVAKGELEEFKDTHRTTEKERSHIIEQLTEQNNRLQAQLKESCKQEEQLNSQLQQLKDKMSLRQNNMTDHLSTLESLRNEIMILSDKKQELERRLSGLAEEREGLSMTLDESSDKIQMLEREKEVQEIELRTKERDLEDLRHTNLNLSDRLEAVSRASSSPSMGHTSLMNEMELSEGDSRPHSHQDLLEMEEDVECDEPVLVPASDSETVKQMKSEVTDAVCQVKVMVEQLRHKRRNSMTSLSTNSSDDFSIQTYKAGILNLILKELKGLVRTRLLREAQGQCSSCGGNTGEDDPKLILEKELHKALETVDRISVELQDAKEQLKLKTDEASQLSGQITLSEAHQNALQEERDNLKSDLENTHLAKDEIVKKAWDTRDQAVARKNKCEIELARTRIDLMQVNSQLLEAITQKVELSQQLDQWQQDMQQLLDEQMRRKLTKMEFGGDKEGSESDSSASGSKSSPRKTSNRLLNLLKIIRK